ncbi:hypothetical protein M7I_2879 [Glarea lozoyensis 74030]|uniref:Uncharacterized protein n=1 Tax=Glarea lozoyensis (strain ATCC 74030 / MF5533) TaxID=1104152 RepID=H0EJZ5_GLAL7|nr:hypothetical protein M7I_2879 [Glarea lozoyensis 74030]
MSGVHYETQTSAALKSLEYLHSPSFPRTKMIFFWKKRTQNLVYIYFIPSQSKRFC